MRLVSFVGVCLGGDCAPRCVMQLPRALMLVDAAAQRLDKHHTARVDKHHTARVVKHHAACDIHRVSVFSSSASLTYA